MPKPAPHVATVILAGGQGTRLHPLTLHHSKPAISYGGRYRLIDIPISNSLNSNYRHIFVIAQYLAAELQHHISQAYRFDNFSPGSIDILTPQINEAGEKEWFEGTADAIRKNLPTLLQSDADYFLILSGDQLYNMDFQEMIRFAVEKDADLTIAALPIPEKEIHRMGILKINSQRTVISFAEKPQSKDASREFLLDSQFFQQCTNTSYRQSHYLASMGIYVFKREALINLLKKDPRSDFGHHLIPTAVQEGKTAAYVFCGYWEDIGTVASYYEANLMLATGNPGFNTYDEQRPIYTRPTFLPGPKIEQTHITDSIICEGSLIAAKEITRSIIGLRSYIQRGTIIRDSVIIGNHLYMPPTQEGSPLARTFSIGEDCLIEKAIIDEHVQIGDRVQLINREKHMNYENGQGLFVRDGILIVLSGTVLPDDFLF
jgi:glucose-1-phosphate adenylyltransferase